MKRYISLCDPISPEINPQPHQRRIHNHRLRPRSQSGHIPQNIVDSNPSDTNLILQMAPKNKALAQKLATLRLPLAPLVPLPSGSPHSSFPRTLLAYHLLTEEELDSIAHHYHQSTPGFWTNQYPENMNWDKGFLNASKVTSASEAAQGLRRVSLPVPASGPADMSVEGGAAAEKAWWTDILASRGHSSSTSAADIDTDDVAVSPRTTSPTSSATRARTRRWSATQMSTTDRVAIKRRKVGKFIGLVGMQTPIEEVEGRIRWCLERAIRVAREESRGMQERELAGRKA